MKKTLCLLFLTTFAVVICFTSCTKKPEKLIVGKWKIESARCTSDEEEDYYMKYSVGENWNFKENGTFVGYLSFFEDEVECDYICDDNTLELKGGDLKGYDHDYEFSIVFQFDIEEISKKEMSLSGKHKITYTYPGDDYSETYTLTGIKYELEKK